MNWNTLMALNIIMYHYVRNNEDHYFDTYCRRKDEFEEQIEFFLNNSEIINPFDVGKINYYLEHQQERAYLLTFDDCYIDHLYCAEYLASRKLSAYFFPPINSLKGTLLDINALHILIGTRGIRIEELLNEVSRICQEEDFKLIFKGDKYRFEAYLDKFVNDARFDDRDTLIFKRILQRDLIGDSNRQYIIDKLFKKFIGKETTSISREFYLGIDNMIKIRSLGMAFGSHCNSHKWLDSLSLSDQKYEIEYSLYSLRELGLISEDQPQSVCYPFGAYNNITIDLMTKLKLDIGFTTKVDFAIKTDEKEYMFKLPRFDTNDCWDSKGNRPCHPLCK